jgi:preprotein translocase subunit YajC
LKETQMKVGTVLAAVAILCMAGVAFADDAKPVSRGIYGQVVTAAGADGKIVVKVGEKEVTVATDANTAVTLDGNAAKVADVKKDMWVAVQPSEGTATKITATTTKPVYKAPPAAPGAPANPAQGPQK